uniref:Uncharacterized protein n=1 Tax=Desertifilum tharense IPPAS B-1220 TaxID=1781255 RepID=A0ACD5H0U7_9CYAN
MTRHRGEQKSMAIPTASSCTDKMNAAIADAIEFGISATKDASDTARGVAQNVGTTTHQFVEQGTETIGRVVTPIAENPVVKYATKLPVLSWVMAALGQVDIDKVEQDIEALRQKYPSESPSQISHRIIVDTALQGVPNRAVNQLYSPACPSPVCRRFSGSYRPASRNDLSHRRRLWVLPARTYPSGRSPRHLRTLSRQFWRSQNGIKLY